MATLRASLPLPTYVFAAKHHTVTAYQVHVEELHVSSNSALRYNRASVVLTWKEPPAPRIQNQESNYTRPASASHTTD
jgi:hypothetical protein